MSGGAQQNRSNGLNWGPFTFRVPFYHTRVEWPDLTQGLVIAGATGLALVPLLQNAFGLTFEQAITVSFIHSMLIAASPIVFGEPYASGWITPALPLVLTFVLGEAFSTPVERFQAMTAMSLEFAAIVFILGITRLGSRFVALVPNALKAGIILGAALAAFKRVFFDEVSLLHEHPISLTVAMAVCLIFTFSSSIARLRQRNKLLNMVAALGLLPGFLLAGIIGPLVGEISYQVEWRLMMPRFVEVYEQVSPFVIGWPSLEIFLTCLPLAVIAYIILFGDLLTGEAILKEAASDRPDDPPDINVDRSHLSVGIRNVLMALFAPFFPTQGVLWAGAHVIIVQRWRQGKETMQSLFSGITSYYVFGIPVLYLLLPLTTLLEPLFPIALNLTLILTGFACAYVAMAMVTEKAEQGTAALTAMTFLFFEPWIGLLVGLVAALTLTDFNANRKPQEESE